MLGFVSTLAENLIASKIKNDFHEKDGPTHFDRKLVKFETSVKIYLRAIVVPKIIQTFARKILQLQKIYSWINLSFLLLGKSIHTHC